MEKSQKPAYSYTAKNYSLLTKPGIIFGNVITTAGGFALGSKGAFNVWLFLATLVGISFVIGSACVFNNYIDREHDKKMKRTQRRPLALGTISAKAALVFGTILGVIGALTLLFFANIWATALALAGFLVYVLLYSYSKHHSIHGTLVGSVAGAIPPVVGYCAVSGRFDLGALILFVMMALWQMPHFFAISIFRFEDYKAASIPILPIKRGMDITKMQMILYVMAFTVSASMLTLFNFTGYSFLIASSTLGLSWMIMGIKGFKATSDKIWARKMFKFSLVVIMGICFVIPFSVC